MNALTTPPSQLDRIRKGRSPVATPIRVMIVDDSLTVRTVFSRMVDDTPDMKVVAGERTAELALARLQKEQVDVILLDLEMPGMGGLEALPKFLEAQDDVEILVVSSLTEQGTEATVAALSMGAADTMLKPRPGGFDVQYKSALLEKIRALGAQESSAPTCGASSSRAKASVGSGLHSRTDIIAIGASTGGIHAMNVFLKNLSPQFDLPICITQHLPTSFVSVFARQLEVASARRTVIAEDGTVIGRNDIAVATGHSHMILQPRGRGFITRTSNEPAASGCLPSVDPMLSSLARNCDGHATAIILSGMGRDGVVGAQELVDAGGSVIAQDAQSSAVWGMPGAVSNAGIASAVLPPDRLAQWIMDDCGVS